MSAFSRLIHAPASRRTFSSYFSSKSGGGGRYFNSAKQQPVAGKVASVTAPTTKVDAASSVEGKQDGVSSSVDTAGSSSSSSSSAASSSNNNNTATSATTGSSQGSTPVENPSSVLAEFTQHHHQQQQHQHLAISAKDFKMHQFFSLHRPLLLINQPSTIFRGVPAGSSFGLSPAPQQQHAKEGDATTGPLGVQYQHLGLDAPLDPFVDPDAEAARQLTRALTLAKASPALEWEATLKRLGLDVAQDADRIGLQAQFAREWEEVLMDSTKRKRRKKMKKHKLKKRRRATRSERLRMK